MSESLSLVPVLATLGTWLHVGACVLLPLAWGVATELVFRLLARGRHKTPRDSDRHFLIEYHI